MPGTGTEMTAEEDMKLLEWKGASDCILVDVENIKFSKEKTLSEVHIKHNFEMRIFGLNVTECVLNDFLAFINKK